MVQVGMKLTTIQNFTTDSAHQENISEGTMGTVTVVLADSEDQGVMVKFDQLVTEQMVFKQNYENVIFDQSNQDQRYQVEIKEWKGGYGFAESEWGEDVFLPARHFAENAGKPQVGMKIECNIYMTKKGYTARNITIPGDKNFLKGYIKVYKQQGKYGFIYGNAHPRGIFFHSTQADKPPVVGNEVFYQVSNHQGKDSAIQIKVRDEKHEQGAKGKGKGVLAKGGKGFQPYQPVHNDGYHEENLSDEARGFLTVMAGIGRAQKNI